MIFVFDHMGVFVAALSGALLAARKEMDIFGFLILGVITGIGGGTIRDVVLGLPVFWTIHQSYLIVAMIASLLAFLIARHSLNGWRRWFFMRLDAAAMALFSVTGSMTAIAAGAPWMVVILMGVMTATAGGLMRDVIAQDTPVVMKGEIVATAATLGAMLALVVFMVTAQVWLAMLVGFAGSFALRVAAISFGLKYDVRKRLDE